MNPYHEEPYVEPETTWHPHDETTGPGCSGRRSADMAGDLEAVYAHLRRTHVLVRTNGEWVAYRPGIRGRWDGWRAIQMLGGLDSDRVGTSPTVMTLAPTPHPDTLGVPDTILASWCGKENA